jgi:archaellum biogenesis protein FlaJ (TadC family)
MNPVIKITIGVIIFLFIIATILFGPIGFFIMILFTAWGIAGYFYEKKQEGKNEKQ